MGEVRIAWAGFVGPSGKPEKGQARALEGKVAEGLEPRAAPLWQAPLSPCLPCSGLWIPAQPPSSDSDDFEGTEGTLWNTNTFEPSDPSRRPILMLM